MNGCLRFWVGLCAASVVACGNTSGDAPNAPDALVPDRAPPRDAGAVDAAGSGHCPQYQPLGNLYWGDLHSHTSYSFDSYFAANRNDPKDAYAFARGSAVTIAAGAAASGPQARIDRPLDFLTVTDHSEFLSATGECLLGATSRSDDPYCKALRAQGGPGQTAEFTDDGLELTRPNPANIVLCRGTPARQADCVTGARTAWQKEQEAAAAANVPCSFTSLVAYEWTAQTGTANLHRNVVFGTAAVPDVPLDYLHYPSALALWRALDAQCKSSAGCDAITIPHNGNASYGYMWNTTDDPAAVPYMERYQVLTEIFQHKGNSECLPGDALSDPKCDFEIVPGSFVGPLIGVSSGIEPNDGGPQGYVRPGLARGLAYAAKNGNNPLEMGIVGATDTHNGTPGNVSERGWVGHLAGKDDTPEARLGVNSKFNPGGITGVWAPENTREAIFAALKRRETYATSGPRIVLRVFAASGVASDAAAQAMCDDPSFPAALVGSGAAPMGAAVHGSDRPYLFVYAMKDSASLTELDMVKLSSDPSGHVSLKIQPFALSGPARTKACVFWSDPDYVKGNQTLYYARVFEEPTPRWSHDDCVARPGTARCDAGGLDGTIEERAWSSPIFFKP